LGFYLAPEALKGSLQGLGLGVGVALLVLAGIFALGGVRWSWEGGTAWAWATAAVRSLWLFALPAAGEEALMRGYLLQALAEEWGKIAALLCTALLFAFLHLWNPELTAVALGNLLVAGLFLGVVYLKTASLWWATGAHLGWNWALGFLGDLPVSGLELVDAPLVDPELGHAGWSSGGAFGPEASLVTTAVLGAAALLIWRSRRLQPGPAARGTYPLILIGDSGEDRPARVEGSSTFGNSWRRT
jgi:hypothetical protein